MPRPFAITAASSSVSLDDRRKGEAHFTVSNRSSRSIDGRAHLEAEDAEAEPWIALRGQAHRTFVADGTERYVAEIEVPPEAPSGNYNFRLDMVGERRPDEDYTRGQTVTFEVPEAESAPAPASGFPWRMIIAAAVVLVLAVGGAAWWFSRNGNNGTDRPIPEPVPDDPSSGPETTTLTDRPPAPLTETEGVVVFAPYSNRDMDPDCTVTNVSARLLGAQGSIEVIEDAVGTNNLHVGVEYSADREMARAEITWEVEHPPGVECTVR